MVRRFVHIVLTGVAVVLLAGTVAFLYLCLQINYTGAHDQAQPADAIIILGARVKPDGQPSPDLLSRTLHGVGLFQQGLAPYLICTGGYQNDRLSAASVACNLAVSRGVPADRVLLADGSMTTSEDALSARHLVDTYGLQTAILVSHPLHLERARLLFEEQGITIYPSATNTDLATIPWPSRVWLTVREAAGILLIGLEAVGVPLNWTTLPSRWIYDLPAAPVMGAN